MEAIIFSKYGNDIFEKTYKRAIVIEYNNKHSKFLEQIDTVDFRDTVALLCDLQHFLDFSQIEISYVINDYEDITEKRKKALKTEREKINILKNYCDDCCNKYSIVYDTLGIPREIIIKQKVSDKCKKELLRVTPNFGVFQYNKKKKPYIWEHK